MKLLMLSVAMACQAFALASQGVCQQQNPQPDRPYLEHTETSRLHFMNFTKYRARRLGSIERSAGSKRTAGSIERGNRICPPPKRKC